jgi:8-oxo-dGTP diphosphatase
MADRFLSVTAGVIACAGRVLVCQRRFDGLHPGKWEFPGGKVEAGEDLAACLRRELEEELGIDATVGRVLWRTQHRYPKRDPIELTFLLVPRYARAIVNRVFAAVEWVAMGDLAAVDFLDGDREFVEQLASGRVRWDGAGK